MTPPTNVCHKMNFKQFLFMIPKALVVIIQTKVCWFDWLLYFSLQINTFPLNSNNSYDGGPIANKS